MKGHTHLRIAVAIAPGAYELTVIPYRPSSSAERWQECGPTMCRQSIMCSTFEPEHHVAQYTAIAMKKIMNSALQRLTGALDDPSHSKLGRAVRDQIFLACNAHAPVGQTSSVRHGSSVRQQCVCAHTHVPIFPAMEEAPTSRPPRPCATIC